MNFIGIQGKYAPAFQFKGKEEYACHSLMKTLSGTQFVVITSPFRTDILYDHHQDRNMSIVRLWSLYKQKEFDQSLLNRFYRSNTTRDSLVEYFVRLIYLQRMPEWFESYLLAFNQQLSISDNEIGVCLRECMHLLYDKKILTISAESTRAAMLNTQFENVQSIVTDTMSRYGLN